MPSRSCLTIFFPMFNIQNQQENPEKKRYQGKYRRSRIYPSFPRKSTKITFIIKTNIIFFFTFSCHFSALLLQRM